MSRANPPRKRRCAAKTAAGKPCRMAPLEGKPCCFAHEGSAAKERAIARKKGGTNRRTPDDSRPPGPVSLRTAADVQAMLELVMDATWLQENSARRSMALATLLGIAAKAIEVGGLEERIAALEAREPQNRPALRRVR